MVSEGKKVADHKLNRSPKEAIRGSIYVDKLLFITPNRIEMTVSSTVEPPLLPE